MKIFIDTSIFIRLFTEDIWEKYQECIKLFKLIENGKIKSYTSNVVLIEIFFVLTSQYKFKKEKVKEVLGTILQTRNLTLIEKTDTPEALKLFDRYKIKYADCLIITQIPPKTRLITYDSEFRKIRLLNVTTPANIVNS